MCFYCLVNESKAPNFTLEKKDNQKPNVCASICNVCCITAHNIWFSVARAFGHLHCSHTNDEMYPPPPTHHSFELIL